MSISSGTRWEPGRLFIKIASVYLTVCICGMNAVCSKIALHENIRIAAKNTLKRNKYYTCIWSQDEDDPLGNLDVTQLDITSQEDYILDEAAGKMFM